MALLGPSLCLDHQKRALRPLRAAVARLMRGAGLAFLLINRFFGLSITTNLSGMARTRAGLSGRPTCRPGAFCPGLSAPQGWPLAAMSAGLPVGTLRPCLTSGLRAAMRGKCRASSCYLAVGQPLMPSCLGCSVVLLPWCGTAAGFGRGGGATLRGVPRFKNSHGRRPSIHGEGEPPKVGEPRRGAPVADRFRRFVFRRRSSYPRVLVFQLQAIFIGKRN